MLTKEKSLISAERKYLSVSLFSYKKRRKLLSFIETDFTVRSVHNSIFLVFIWMHLYTSLL